MSSKLSRADLLSALSASPNHLLTGIADALGYGYQGVAESPDTLPGTQPSTPQQESGHGAVGAEDTLYLPKREQRYWIIKACKPLEPNSLDSGEWPETGPEDDTEPQALPERPLRSTGQWQNLWDCALTGRRQGRNIDLKRSLNLLRRCEPVRELPRRERPSFNRPVVVVLEWSEVLYPIWPDMRAAWHSLSRLLGKRALRGFFVSNGPLNEWRCLHQRGGGNYADIPPASQVVLVGGFGASGADIEPEWRQLIRQLDGDGHQTTLVTARHLPRPPCPVHALDPVPASLAVKTATEALLAAIARHCLPDRLQLRHLRQALPGAGVEAELAVWQHDEILCLDGYLQITDSAASDWRQAKLPNVVKQALGQCRTAQDGAARDMSKLQSTLGDAPQAGDFPALQSLGKALRRQKKQSNSHEKFLMRSLLPGLRELADSQPEAEWQPLLAEAQRVALQSNEALPLKEQGLDEIAGCCYLFQQRQQLRLSREIGEGQLPLVKLSSPPFCLETRTILPTLSPVAYNALDLSDADNNYHLKAMRRPTWAECIWRDRDGLFAAHTDGALLRLDEANPNQPRSRWRLVENPWPWAQEAGVDDYGLWAEFTIGKAHQRMRWIPPGSFLMGSPEGEVDREDNETQHPVTLTYGYWLAETSCSQVLWQAVTGDSPSNFKGNELPVEQVSWDDCQTFIASLRGKLPGLNFSLPTEAQWEYACRAGTQTVFNWGDALNTEKANYYGNFSYADGEKGEYRGRTLPVRSFEPNHWGLYQMHGNVREWCNDWRDYYPAEPVIDPAGPEGGHERVLRGGSWNDRLGRYLRSVYRYALPPDFRHRSIGLRLAGGNDPQASKGARSMSADRRARSDQRIGAQVADGGEKRGER